MFMLWNMSPNTTAPWNQVIHHGSLHAANEVCHAMLSSLLSFGLRTLFSFMYSLDINLQILLIFIFIVSTFHQFLNASLSWRSRMRHVYVTVRKLWKCTSWYWSTCFAHIANYPLIYLTIIRQRLSKYCWIHVLIEMKSR